MPKAQAKRKARKAPAPYKVKLLQQPAAKGAVIKNQPPKIKPLRDGLRIKHRELLSTLSQTTNFAWRVYNFPLNPGLPGTFPWLSGVARMFEQYVFNGLSFHYIPIAPTTYPGSAVLCVDYDPRDAEYNLGLTRTMMMQNATATSTPVWGACTTQAKVASLMGGMSRKFVRVFDVDPLQSTSVRSSDCGDFIVGLWSEDYAGPAATRVYGDIWVEYDVTLMNPQPNMNPPSYFQTLDASEGALPTVPISQAFGGKTETAVQDYVKQDGGLYGYQGYTATVSSRKNWWGLIDLIPGAYYYITAVLNEAAAGVSDTLEFVTADPLWSNLQLDSHPTNRVSTTSGGSNVSVRGLFKAMADRATLVINSATASGGTSAISGSLLSIVPTPSLKDIFVHGS